ncbi:uncharacterized protein EAE97_008035 [Botrytis byssoidea]|uniref:C2H2-type domain-containing protein n=1 Tax=Botrytis byssoidea TaxID=139641 RepID=A0A9P5M3L3_9HELO|nr:uncharacterized protein EAE97_008035 [Botrytis byssoidea]KAF7936669.1 hypothetical protein EAE97_008035 [Botrytis byssoidea]
MTLPSAEQTSPTALSRDVDSWSSNPEFLGTSHVSSSYLDDLMQNVPNLTFLNGPIESGTWFTPHFVHGLHATQLEPSQDSYQALAPVQMPSKHVSNFNKKAKSKSNAYTPAPDTHLSGTTTRVKGSARISKTKKYPGGASAFVIRKRARERKEHLFQAFAPLEKAKEALKPYSKLSRRFKQKSESLFLQLEKLIDEAIFADDTSDFSSMLEASNLEMDSAYGSFSDIPLSDVSSSVFEQRDIHLERQTTTPSSIQNLELHSDEETTRPFQPLSPTYSCTYGPGDERCPYATSRKSDWIRHEESEKHWPQKRYMCMLCAEPRSDEDLNPCCTYCSLAFSTIEEVQSHSLNCIEARRKEKTFTGAKTDHFQAHLVDVHHRPGLDTTSAAWTYNHKTKWQRYCGFCTYHFIDWEERKNHVADHFKEGADISNWDPLLHNPRRKNADEPGLPPRNDDEDNGDDDDDHSHQHGRGRFSEYEATQSAYATTTGSSSSSCDLSNNGYLDWDNNEGGWGQYNLDYEKRCSNSLVNYVNRPRRNRQDMKRNNPGYEAYENECTSESYSTGDEVSRAGPTSAVSRTFIESTIMATLQMGKLIILSCHHSQIPLNNDICIRFIDNPPTPFWNYLRISNKALETVNDTYVSRENSLDHKISQENIRIKRDSPKVTLNSQRSPREHYHSRTHPRCSRELGQLPDWQPRSLNANSKEDKETRFKYECKCHTGSGESSTGKDYVIGHQIFARRQRSIDHVKSHHQKVAGTVKHLLSRAIFDNQSKPCPHVPVKEWKIRRVFGVSYSGLLHHNPGYYEDGSLLTSSDTISWGDEGNYTYGPGEQLQDRFFEFARDQKHRALGQSCKRKSNCSECQGFGGQRASRSVPLLWDCARSSGITEKQLAWMIRPSFKPVRSASDRPRCQKAKPVFQQSVALERYLSDYNFTEHLAYLASRHIGGDERSPSSALMHSPCFTSNEEILALQVLQKLWVCLFRVPGELNIKHIINVQRETIDDQDVDTHLLLGGIRAFGSNLTTSPADIDTVVSEKSNGDAGNLE